MEAGIYRTNVGWEIYGGCRKTYEGIKMPEYMTHYEWPAILIVDQSLTCDNVQVQLSPHYSRV